MIEKIIRIHYQRILVDPVASRLTRKLTPNHITFASGILGALVVPALLLDYKLLATLLLLSSGYCDTLDGTLARFQKKSSNAGAMLDIIVDRFVEFSVIFGLFALNPGERGWGAIFMLGSILLCITSFLVVGIFTQNNSNKGFHYNPGLMERAEAFLFFIAMIWLPNNFNILSSIFCLLVLWTATLRARNFYEIKNSDFL